MSDAATFLLPLFPLPNLVFFPRTRLPLHVFEPRYRQMVKDVLETDQRIGIILLKPGWESDYFGAPGTFACGTLGTIEQAVPLEDNRYNIVVRGDVRFRVLDEVSRGPVRHACSRIPRRRARSKSHTASANGSPTYRGNTCTTSPIKPRCRRSRRSISTR